MKVGLICIGDENDQGYTYNFMRGVEEATAQLAEQGINVEWVYKTQILEDSGCEDANIELADAGCQIIINNSYGFESYMLKVAPDYPEIEFISCTNQASAVDDLANTHNAFANIYEGRYLAGVAGGMKLQQLIDEGTITADEAVIGYVAAFPFAEVVSGYTAFYLGAKSVWPQTVLEVMYTNSWFDIDKEGAAAEALIANGAVIVGQHADSTGAPAATQKLKDAGTVCYSVGYNIDMLDTAPTAALTSATNVWKVYYKEAFAAAMNGEEVPVDWAKGYDDGAVAITELGPECAEGTADKVAEVEAALKDGTLHVFDTSTFTVDGQTVTSAPVDLTFYDYTTGEAVAVYQGETKEAIHDGYFDESTLRSAPYFTLRIDGITEDAEAVA